MAKDPAFLFYPNDYIGGTMGMTFEEKGAYMELLMLQFNRGHMTSHMIGQTIGQLWDNIKDKFEVDEKGAYYNARLDLEKEKRAKYTASRRNNKKGVNQHNKKRGHMTSHTVGRMENENEIVNENKDEKENVKNAQVEIWPTYDDFWTKYPLKKDKKRARPSWDRLTQKEKEAAVNYLDDYITECEHNGTPFRMPSTYLNNETWENEIKFNTNTNKKTTNHGHTANELAIAFKKGMSNVG